MKKNKNEFLEEIRLQKDWESVQDILLILIPRFVIESIQKSKIYLKNLLFFFLVEMGLNVFDQKREEVGILFCDICDFDKIIQLENKRVVTILDKIFRIFDNLCKIYGIQKIEVLKKNFLFIILSRPLGRHIWPVVE